MQTPWTKIKQRVHTLSQTQTRNTLYAITSKYNHSNIRLRDNGLYPIQERRGFRIMRDDSAVRFDGVAIKPFDAIAAPWSLKQAQRVDPLTTNSWIPGYNGHCSMPAVSIARRSSTRTSSHPFWLPLVRIRNWYALAAILFITSPSVFTRSLVPLLMTALYYMRLGYHAESAYNFLSPRLVCQKYKLRPGDTKFEKI